MFPRWVDYGALTWSGKLAHGLRPFWNADAERALARFLAGLRPDVVHEHSTAFHLTPAVLRACTRRGVPVVQTIHGAGLFCPAHGLMRGGRRPCREESCIRGNAAPALLHGCIPGGAGHAFATAAVHQFYRLAGFYRRVDAWICASDAMLQVARRAGLPRERLFHVPYGFSRAFFERPVARGEGEYFLFAGRLEREKGVHHLLRALARLPRRVELRVAGSGGEERALREQAARLGLENVRFLGWQGREDLAALYRGAIASVLPCDWFEAFGLTVVESFAAGRPVVASRVGGLPEIVTDGVDGLLVEPGDPEALAAALARLDADRAAAAEMGRRGRIEAERRFGAGVHHDALLRVYSSVLERRAADA